MKIGEIRICSECGKEFEAKKYNHYTCSEECGKIREVRVLKERRARNRKTKRNKSLMNIAQKAKEEGLTYGQYVSKYGL